MVRALQQEVMVISVPRATIEVKHHIKAWRTAAGLSTDKLGELAGCTGSMISQLERGKTTYTQKTLEGIAQALKVQAWQLLAGSPEDNNQLWHFVLKAAMPDFDMSAISEENNAKIRTMVSNNCAAAIKSATDLKLL